MIPFHAQFSVLQNVHMGLVLVIFYLICGSTLSSHMGWSHFHALWWSVLNCFGIWCASWMEVSCSC